jgi:hypothetical protein
LLTSPQNEDLESSTGSIFGECQEKVRDGQFVIAGIDSGRLLAWRLVLELRLPDRKSHVE